MDKSQKQLLEVCLELARETHWERKPVDMAKIQKYADELYKEAMFEAENTESLGGSVELVTRAVRYILQVHAIPPIKDDIGWFRDTLRALIEVACPNSGVEGEARKFLVDMQKGISSFLVEET